VKLRSEPAQLSRLALVQQLVGVAEIASGLRLSKQRADALTRTRGFPDPVENVLVIDGLAEQAVRDFFDDRPRLATAEETLALFHQRANRLPAQPRLWRRSVVQEWATNTGREWHDEPSKPATAGGFSP
jgi:hypothetical protein